MHTFLIAESDSACKRNAFVFLAHCSMPKAVEYILSIYDSIGSLDEALQMSIIEIIRLDCKSDSSHRVRLFLYHSEAFLTHLDSSQDISAASLNSSMLPHML
jgi:vesicle coat complex subunit